jgi:hypothetical protein
MIEPKTTYPAGTVIKSGGESFEVAAGKGLKLETSPNGETYLDEIVPSGEKWTVNVSIQIKIEDA